MEGRFNKQVVNRMTLRMQTAIAAFNITRHILEIVNFPDALCRAAGGALLATELGYYSLNIAMSANMQLMFLNERLPSAKWEWRYWTVALALPALVSTAALVMGLVEREQSGLCGLTFNRSDLSKFITFGIRPATVIYCFTIPIYTLTKLHFQRDTFVKLKHYLSRKADIQAQEFKGKLSRVIYRR
ncbi:hypothetical protein DSO57_1036880 [Entomophthora muscae]|uniref:Uncharacterized protein n=1 Tax=Entomophthora muscae TaxID=34485 RepID=A0ACC2TLE2_9FUNG|nr:hypothetical protein DSO57_1036880 [Entomophthora muscae]